MKVMRDRRWDCWWRSTPPEKELEGERDPELRRLPRMDADGDMRMAERSRRPSSCRILHDMCNLSGEEEKSGPV